MSVNMAGVGNVNDRWVWRASTHTRNPHPPPPGLTSDVHGATQVNTSPVNPTIKTSSGLPTLLPSASPASPPASHTTYTWLWSKDLVNTQSTVSWPGNKITSSPSWLVKELSLSNTTVLQGLVSPSSWFVTSSSSHTAHSSTSESHQYTTNMEVYDTYHLVTMPNTARESQAERFLPSSVLVVSILVASLLVSLVANCVMVFAILRRSYLRQTIFVLHLNLAASDLLASVVSIPVAIVVISRGDGGSGEDYIGGGGGSGGPSVGACLLLNAGMVLMSYVSVGSIVGICTVRWCQFHNFSKTRGQEKVIVRLFLLLLWTTAVGISTGLIIRQALAVTEITCTPLHLVAILNNTLPLSLIFISLGLIVVALVNHLATRKLSNTQQVCPQPGYHTPPILCRYLAHLPPHTSLPVHTFHHNPTSEQSSFNGYTQSFSHHGILHNTLQDKCFPLTENTSVSTEAKKSSGFAQGETNTTPLPLPPSPLLPPLPFKADSIYPGHEKLPQGGGQVNLGLRDNTSETELETDHLYEPIEPSDVQEIISIDKISKTQQIQGILLPNAVQDTTNTRPSVRRLETILVNTVNTPPPPPPPPCWSTHDAMLTHTTHHLTIDSIDTLPTKSVIKVEELPDVMTEVCHATNVPTSSQQFSSSIRETPLLPQTWLPHLSCTPSPSTGYLADVSASSSKPDTPHHKLGRRRLAKRLIALTKARSVPNYSDDEQPKASPAMPVKGRSYRHKCSPQAPQGNLSESLSGNKMNPVLLKCIHTSRCLSALFIVFYLPFLFVHILVCVVGGSVMLVISITYMSCFLAVHPCLYGYQSPLVRRAMCQVGRPTKTSAHFYPPDAADPSPHHHHQPPPPPPH